MDTLSQQIKMARKRANMTQAQLAQAAGTTQADISDLERQQIDVRLSTLMKIAIALNLDLIAVPREHKNKVMGIIRDPSEPVEDITLLDKYGVSDDEDD